MTIQIDTKELKDAFIKFMPQLTSQQKKHLTIMAMLHTANEATLQGNTDARIDSLVELLELELTLDSHDTH